MSHHRWVSCHGSACRLEWPAEASGCEGRAMSGLHVTQIDPVSVLIPNRARSRRFYRDVLGLKEIAKPKTFDFSVLWFDLGGQQLHLLLKPRPDAVSPRHFAL